MVVERAYMMENTMVAAWVVLKVVLKESMTVDEMEVLTDSETVVELAVGMVDIMVVKTVEKMVAKLGFEWVVMTVVKWVDEMVFE